MKSFQINIKIQIIFISLLFVLSSCNSDYDIIYNDYWNVDRLLINGVDKSDLLIGSVVEFKEDNECSLPILELIDLKYNLEYYINGKYEINKNNKLFVVNVKSNNKYYNGKGYVKLWYNQENYKVTLTYKKDSLLFICNPNWERYTPDDKRIIENCENMTEFHKYIYSVINK